MSLLGCSVLRIERSWYLLCSSKVFFLDAAVKVSPAFLDGHRDGARYSTAHGPFGGTHGFALFQDIELVVLSSMLFDFVIRLIASPSKASQLCTWSSIIDAAAFGCVAFWRPMSSGNVEVHCCFSLSRSTILTQCA